MTVKEGKDFLQQSLEEQKSDAKIDDLICYKYGSVIKASTYRTDSNVTTVDWSKERSSVGFVVKCYIHLGFYVAWPKAVGFGNGKYIIYKKDLIEMEQNADRVFDTVMIDGQMTAFLFRGEKGVNRFIKEKLFGEEK